MAFPKLRAVQGHDKPLSYITLIGAGVLLIGIANPVYSGYNPDGSEH